MLRIEKEEEKAKTGGAVTAFNRKLSRAPARAQAEGHRGHYRPSPSHIEALLLLL